MKSSFLKLSLLVIIASISSSFSGMYYKFKSLLVVSACMNVITLESYHEV